jgi:putative ABC transport system permease protein
MSSFLRHFFAAWTWKMAWRDSRKTRRRLLLFSMSIVFGVAALAAIGSLAKNLEWAIEEQSQTLLGADLSISSRRPFSPDEEKFLAGIGGDQSRQTSLNSMVLFPASGGTRLVQVRAFSGNFPYYGRIETEPPEAAQKFREGRGALVEANLLIQYGAKVGDLIKLGSLTVPVVGELKKVPGESAAVALVSPRILLPGADLPETGLLRPGSIAQYTALFKFPAGTDVEKLVDKIQPELERDRLSFDTVAKRRANLGRSMENMAHFLNLSGLVALLLGGVGVASAIHVHVKQKINTVAVLRCLGGSASQTFAIYFAQGTALGCVGAILGGAAGLAAQLFLPPLLKDFIPFEFHARPAWAATGRACGAGLILCMLFSLLPLLSIRLISPWTALRVVVETGRGRRDPLRWLVVGCLAALVLAFTVAQAPNAREGLGIAAGLAAAFGVLTATAKLLAFIARRFVPPGLPFVVRQGLANLHRPDNRTLLLLLSLGLSAFLLVGLFLVQHILTTDLVASGNQKANAVLFDIQPDQKDAISQTLIRLGLPVLDEAPIITMRISAINGRSAESILSNKTERIPSWTLRREYRSTYADSLRAGEKITAGAWIGRAPPGATEAPISVEQGIAKELGVALGDKITFDIQGVPLTGRIASLREVDWRRIQPNFFILFPRGVLEDAPSMNVLVTRVNSSEESARMQREIVKGFPNVSVIDLTLILQTLDSIIGKVSFVIRFMALFTVFTGILVLAGALVSSHFQRVRESVLLRALGASRRQVLQILLVEYLAAGALAALTGVILAVGAAWALAQWVLQVHFAPNWSPVIVALIALPALTVSVGLLMSRGLLAEPPLKVLRDV